MAVAAVQGVALTELPVEDFLGPITGLCRTNFLTATAAARHMAAQGMRVIVTLTASSAKETRHQDGRVQPGECGGSRHSPGRLAFGEHGRSGVRVVGLRSNFTPETHPGVTDEQARASC